jgi:hypothetical protein
MKAVSYFVLPSDLETGKLVFVSVNLMLKSSRAMSIGRGAHDYPPVDRYRAPPPSNYYDSRDAYGRVPDRRAVDPYYDRPLPRHDVPPYRGAYEPAYPASRYAPPPTTYAPPAAYAREAPRYDPRYDPPYATPQYPPVDPYAARDMRAYASTAYSTDTLPRRAPDTDPYAAPPRAYAGYDDKHPALSVHSQSISAVAQQPPAVAPIRK